jgi:hypothetical protein
MKNKKAVLGDLQAIGVGIAGLAIALVVVFLILGEGKAQIGSDSSQACVNTTGLNAEAIFWNGTADTCHNSSGPTAGLWPTSFAINSTKSLQGAVDDIPGWVPIIIIALIGTVLFALVKMFK